MKFVGLPSVLIALFSLALVLSPVGGCDTTKLTADSTAGLFDRAAPAFEQYWDYETAMKAAPATIVQLEGILHIVPDNPGILLQTSKAYIGYAFGWVEDQAEIAEFAGDLEEQERLHNRARLMYTRATDLMKHRLRQNVKGFDKATTKGIDDFNAFLKKNFKEKSDAEILLWTGYAWGSKINMSRDDMESVADLAYAIAMVERSVELDHTYYSGAGLTFLAVATTNAMSADMDKAKAYFESAMQETERGSLVAQINMARHYAVKKGDRELFTKLLNEVLDAKDVRPETRLTNRIARRRAERYLANADELF